MFEEMGIPYIEPEIETPGTVLKMMQDGRFFFIFFQKVTISFFIKMIISFS